MPYNTIQYLCIFQLCPNILQGWSIILQAEYFRGYYSPANMSFPILSNKNNNLHFLVPLNPQLLAENQENTLQYMLLSLHRLKLIQKVIYLKAKKSHSRLLLDSHKLRSLYDHYLFSKVNLQKPFWTYYKLQHPSITKQYGSNANNSQSNI